MTKRSRALRFIASPPGSAGQSLSTPKMNFLVLLSLLFLVPILLFIAWLAVSSCMGDRFRARVSGITFMPRTTSFGRSYVRGLMAGSGSAGWEQIEMEDMMGEDEDDDDDED